MVQKMGAAQRCRFQLLFIYEKQVVAESAPSPSSAHVQAQNLTESKSVLVLSSVVLGRHDTLSSVVLGRQDLFTAWQVFSEILRNDRFCTACHTTSA